MEVSARRIPGRVASRPSRRPAANPLWEEVEESLNGLLDVVARVADRDFSVKPPMMEGDGILARFQVAFRFMIEDLELALTELERERERLQLANARLRDLDQMKTRFVNAAAHELGTPLTPVQLQLYLLEHDVEHPLLPTQRDSLAVVRRNFDRFARLVRDLLDVTRLESGKVRIRPEPVDLAALVRGCVETYGAMADRRGVTLECVAPSTLPLQADPARVEQIVFNLLSNALRSTPRERRIRIVVRSEGAEAVVDVVDEGVGLTPGDMAALFLPFSQGPSSSAGPETGTGLGLFISRGLAQRHGGTVTCASGGPGKGATFTLRLPVDPQSVGNLSYKSASADNEDLPSKADE